MLVVDTGVCPSVRPAESSATGKLDGDALRALAQLECVEPTSDGDPWDADANRRLDPFAGHGTFIAGLIARLAPGCEITVERGLTSYGDTDDVLIAQALVERFTAADEPPFDVVSMSFSGFCENDDPPIALSQAIAHIQAKYRTTDDFTSPHDAIRERVVFVAAAGNDSSCRPTWPASFESVISVGALGPNGPAPFTNYGPWVQACAPGVDIISTFFDLTGENAGDDAEFDGWAQWSGTSFSAPIVAAEIAWEWMAGGCDGRVGAAAAWLLQRSSLYRHPWLGAVVNVY